MSLAVQYESITAEDTGEGLVRNLKYFLGINPSLTGNQLPLTNWRHQRNTPLKLNDTTVRAAAQGVQQRVQAEPQDLLSHR